MQSSSSSSSLTQRQKCIAMIAADAAVGDMDQLESDLKSALSNLTINEVKEILVQMYSYCGSPRSLNAINRFKGVIDERIATGIKDQEGEEAQAFPKDRNRNEYGAAVRAKLTGQSLTSSLQPAPYAQCVPAIDDFLKEHLFADIFSRGVLSEQDREIATVAALSAKDRVEAQRDAHIGIAKRQGISER